MNLFDLETRGYVIIQSFLSLEDTTILVDDYNNRQQIDNFNYTASLVSKQAEHILFQKIKSFLTVINEKTNISVDTLIPIACYLNNKDCDFKWHQDHESFYVHQQHTNYLNFYIPILKPDSSKSGLGVIPFDSLGYYSPQYINEIINSGATRFYPKENYTEVYNDNNGKNYTLPVNLNDIAVYPELKAGDLLLMRGDIIHKTQDIFTDRVAVTVRCVDGEFMLNKNVLLDGCEKKQAIIQNNQRMYDNILNVFGDKTHIKTKELYKDESCLIATKY